MTTTSPPQLDPTRRSLLRGAAVGGAVLWTVPVVQVLSMSPASADLASGTPKTLKEQPPGHDVSGGKPPQQPIKEDKAEPKPEPELPVQPTKPEQPTTPELPVQVKMPEPPVQEKKPKANPSRGE